MKTIYCVGYTYGNPGKAGWGVVVFENEKVIQTLSGGYRISTDPRMHLMAFCQGLGLIVEGEQARCVVCSEYVYEAITQGRLYNWERRWGWNDINGKERPNRDLWQHVMELLQSRNIEMVFQRKQQGDRGMWMADKLAKEAAAHPSELDEGYELSERYLAYQKAREEVRVFLDRLLSRRSGEQAG